LRTFYLAITAFICGFCVMGLELLGFRLFGPTFGYSSYVSGSLIGIILAALSIGYIFGGRLADKRPRASLLYKLIVLAGGYLFLMLPLYRRILDASYMKMGTVVGSMAATFTIYGVPMILLSMVSPFVIRLLTLEESGENVGKIAGGIYGLSTIGSILGTFGTAFFLIWALGSHMTLLLLATVVLLVGVGGLLASARKWAVAVLLVAIAPFSFPRAEKDLLLRRESFYNDIRVLEREDGTKSLSVNRWTSYSVAVSEETEYLTGRSYYDFYNAAALLTEPREILILGMGAGTSVKQYLHFFPEAHIDAVEIDPEIIRIAKDRRYFGIKEGPRLKIFAEDARPFLRKARGKRYQMIEVDMFQGGPYVPFYVTSKEFFALVSDHLAEDGVVAMNVLSLTDDLTLLCSIEKTLKTVFPNVFAVRVDEGSNYLLVCMKRKLPVPGGVTKVLQLKRGTHPGLSRVISRFIDGILLLPENEEAHVLTDDKSDVERITFKMTDKYIRQIPLTE
jgi:spermidine synthase